ncbi:uncharacterized protein LOC118742395 [Rhagoletis pomonella]|uniref:uncharacterized protein LOC118742395 n=1 Tax=Rhagoletis pomonella TaxID=28610 RepID=UPI0017836A7C|nr:uncharacterized protein LOC118742395 [Rhagoletis pomonella]XP_036330339.1 uncharacterized protein LOC118742395 [Rhagoletis pomonella]XP_036330340.1 uncharacterized protein LOC118742395 [Rhagoletis pomonella]
MREHRHTTPRRRGPMFPLPAPRGEHYGEQSEVSESPYYTIDNTEDIYGTTLLPSQRCYVDPWDLENYDYVRKKLSSTPVRSSPEPYYDTSLSTSPYYMMTSSPQELHEEVRLAPSQRLAATIPRNRDRSHWNETCHLDCCISPVSMQRRRYEDTRSDLYGVGHGKYEDYMSHMMTSLEAEEDVYTGYGGVSSSSSTEVHSSIDEEHTQASAMAVNKTSGYNTTMRRRSGPACEKPAPYLEFPAPPSLPPPPLTFDYSKPSAASPYYSSADCLDCSMIYATSPSIYGYIDRSYKGSTIYGSTIGRRPSSSLCSGIYGHKFGLSKKGLLQIDYSCSWNDLDRIIGRHY